jgi:hypothetical protein
MSANGFFAKFLRFIGIVLMGLTGGFTVLGGIGTFCAAVFPQKYESMTGLIPYQWLYILFMLVTIAIGVWGIWATVLLVKGTSNSYTLSIQALVTGVLVGGFHIYMSQMLRGKSMPVDMVVYTTLFTLVVFLIFRIPFIWQGVNFEKPNVNENKRAGGAAAILLGILTLTIQYTMASTHTWGGVNYAGAFNTSMTIVGVGLLLLGVGILVGVKHARKRVLELRTQE